ncbi:RsfA family transcriptional regulator [Paenibacillus sp. FSL H3-0286]|uniref:RsfA family transcriptional regulator n=1 Tax=Paenibacillus sp. FSL H3-0286 TaxID=2921427 RepID=UPI003254B245
MRERKDSWSQSDDSLLSDIALDYIRTGKTQLQAFEKVSEALNRTPAACGFRWNSTLRHKFAKEIDEAKIIRYSLKDKLSKKVAKQDENNLSVISIDLVLISLLNIKREYEEMKQMLLEKEKTIQEYEAKNTPDIKEVLSDDMKNFLRILGKSTLIDNFPQSKKEEPAI